MMREEAGGGVDRHTHIAEGLQHQRRCAPLIALHSLERPTQLLRLAVVLRHPDHFGFELILLEPGLRELAQKPRELLARLLEFFLARHVHLCDAGASREGERTPSNRGCRG